MAQKPYGGKNGGRAKPAGNRRGTFEKNDRFVPEDDGLKLVGRNAVLEALNTGAHIDRILIKKPDAGADGRPVKLEGSLRVIAAKAKERGIVIAEVARDKLDSTLEGIEGAAGSNHQGVIALCPAFPYYEISDILADAKSKGEDPFIVILDGVGDPHNLGAVLRTADACGAHGVIIPKRRACGLTAGAVRASAGAAAYVKVARVTNISNAVNELKKSGVWVACADRSGGDLYTAPLEGPIAVVIGGEDGGVGQLVRKCCDFSVNIPMYGKITSLNASVAAAVVMYEVVRRKAASAPIRES